MGRFACFGDVMRRYRDRQRGPGLASEQLRNALKEVQAVYQDLAARPVERQCIGRAECCHFKLTGKTPLLTAGEALAVIRAWRATGRKDEQMLSADGVCPFLERIQKRCLIYEGRPFGCRTHFCQAAGGPYARRDVLDLIRRLEAVDDTLGGEGGLPLEQAVRKWMKEV